VRLSDAETIDTFKATDTKIEPIRIGLIADTHISKDAKMLPPHVKEAFKDVDLILHAGDINLPGVLDELETIAPVRAARGNEDWEIPEDHRLKDDHVLHIAGLNLWLTHAGYYPELPESLFHEKMEREFGNRIDIIVFGDTHVATVERFKGILVVNPGSPTVPNGLFELGSVGILEIMGNMPKARIVQLSDFPIPFHRKLFYYVDRGTEDYLDTGYS